MCITYNSLLFAEWLHANGFSGDAHTKRVPGWVFSTPKPQRLVFFAGYVESDGRIHGGSVRLRACNEKLIEDLRTLAMSCGIHVNRIRRLREVKSIKIGNKIYPKREYVSYVTFVSSLNKVRGPLVRANQKKLRVVRFNPVRFNRITATRRLENLPKHLGLLAVTSIDYVGEKPTYDVEVEAPHNFVANGIIVHNSKLTMKYPSIYLLGSGAKGEILSVAFAGKGQHQNREAKLYTSPLTRLPESHQSLCPKTEVEQLTVDYYMWPRERRA